MIKNEFEIDKMRTAGRILAKVLKELEAVAEEGVTLKDLDELAHGLIKKAGAEPAFLGYQPSGAERPFPAALCTSLNEVVVHGIPTKRRLKSGDLLKLDLGVKYRGYFADAAVSLGIGTISKTAAKLIEATREALTAAIAAAKAGAFLGDIGHAIAKTAAKHQFKIIKGLVGHGIGSELHEEPEVPNEGRPKSGLRLQAGMTLALEPMLSAGSERVARLSDDSYATIDGSLTAQFEHTIAVTEQGAEVLTVI